MSERKLWLWQIRIVNGDIAGVSASPIDHYRGMGNAVVTSMYRNLDGEFVAEVETVASTRTDAEHLAREAFEADVPEDMRRH